MTRFAMSGKRSRRARSAMVLMESVSYQLHRRAVCDGFGAEDADTSGASVHRYRRCVSISTPKDRNCEVWLHTRQ